MVLITILFLVIMIIISILPLMSDGSKKFYFLLQNHMALYKGSVKVSGSAGSGFDPQNTGTVGQVLTKTSTGYNWDDATGSIESSNDTYDNIIYLTQAEYDALTEYEPNTLYSTPEEGEEGELFNPENVGTEGQVLTKTASGYAFCDSQGGGDTGPKLDIMVVGGGGGGGCYNSTQHGVGGGGGGGGGVVKKCFGININSNLCIYVGEGGAVNTNGGNSCVNGDNISIVALGGGGGGRYCYIDGNGGGNGGGGGGVTCEYCQYTIGGVGFDGFQGGAAAYYGGGGGGGAGGPGSDGTCGGCGGGIGGQGILGTDFKPGSEGCLFGTGGSGGKCSKTNKAYPGGGMGGAYYENATNATYYGGGGGGQGTCTSNGGIGYQGIVIIKYPTDGSYGIASSTGGDNCYTCDGYCYVEFTQDGTFTPTYS